MKRTAAVAALLALAACQTNPYAGDPYASPYPAPYPYPPTDPNYPVGYPPVPMPGDPGAPPPVPPECPISVSRDWSAWINRMPGPDARPRLVVSGKVVTRGGGYSVAFDRDLQIRESWPAQAFVTLQVAEPDTPSTGQPVTHDVRWEWPLSQPVGSVVVSCGDKTLAEITRIQTAY